MIVVGAAPGVPAKEATGFGDGFAFLLNGGHDAGPAARRAVLAGNGAVPASLRGDLLLLLTELVTNAVRHSGVRPEQSVRVELRWSPGRVRGEVVDPGTSFTKARVRFRRDETGGWGLLLVDRIADRWGVTRIATGTRVWFEIGSEQ